MYISLAIKVSDSNYVTQTFKNVSDYEFRDDFLRICYIYEADETKSYYKKSCVWRAPISNILWVDAMGV